MKLLAFLALGYGLIVAAMYAAQTSMIFPGTRLPSRPIDQPLAPARLTFEPEPDIRLAGMLFSPRGRETPSEDDGAASTNELLIGFGGNAQDAETLGQDLAERFPELHVAVFHYRGYGGSTGAPSETALVADALAIHDRLVADLEPDAVFALGISLGSGVAARLSKERRLAGIFLVTPYDSIEAVARQAYPWLPVRLLLKHRFDTLEAMAGNETAVAIIAAADDRVIAPARTDRLRRALARSVFDRTIDGAGHAEIHSMPVYWEALGEALDALRTAGS